jgi:8-oxo-dGTP pyrophosphatase MutT (NUDIX family)
VLLVDERDRVLLFLGDDPATPDSPRWWYTVGGGLNEGESADAAARREVLEETGVVVDDVVGPLWTRDTEFDFLGSLYVVHEVYFLARVSDVTVDNRGWEQHETDSIHEHRWWSVDELRACEETVYPPGLADLLDGLLRDGPPAEVTVIAK